MATSHPKPVEMTLYGVKLSNKDLLQTDNLQMQLAMLLEIMADFNNRLHLRHTNAEKKVIVLHVSSVCCDGYHEREARHFN